jgi:formate-dependent phosphoribosylglycinamide formyltransferase (GAR transformylase)
MQIAQDLFLTRHVAHRPHRTGLVVIFVKQFEQFRIVRHAIDQQAPIGGSKRVHTESLSHRVELKPNRITVQVGFSQVHGPRLVIDYGLKIFK